MTSKEVWGLVKKRMQPTFLCRMIVHDGVTCAEMVSPVNVPVESHRTIYELERHLELRYFGRISFWSYTYGFIKMEDGTQVYVHQMDCKDGLQVDTLLQFDLDFVWEYGRWRAYNCVVVAHVPHIYDIGDTHVIPTLGNSLHDLRSMGCHLPLGTIGGDCIRPHGRYIFVRDKFAGKQSPPTEQTLNEQPSTCPSSTSEYSTCGCGNDLEPGEIMPPGADDSSEHIGRFDRKRRHSDSDDEDE